MTEIEQQLQDEIISQLSCRAREAYQRFIIYRAEDAAGYGRTESRIKTDEGK